MRRTWKQHEDGSLTATHRANIEGRILIDGKHVRVCEVHEPRVRDTDIYAYDLTDGVERPVVVAPGAQRNPSVRGSRVVWDDNRNNPDRDKPQAGCDNCADNRRDIYLFDLTTGKERPLAEDQGLKARPAIDGNLVAWVTYPNGSDPVVVLLDLTTGVVRQVTTGDMSAKAPMLSDRRLLWVVEGSREDFPANTGVYLKDLRTNAVQKLTSDGSPSALLDRQTVIITEQYQMGGRAYALTLAD